MNETKTQTNLVAWNGETYAGAGDWYDKFKNGEDWKEYTEDLDNDELLRLAMYAWNTGYALVPEDMGAFISEENDSFRGEAESEAEFTRELLEDAGDISKDLPSYIVIDYQATWDRNLRHDFFSYKVIDIDGNYRQFFWWSN
jgi:antirestriction protein